MSQQPEAPPAETEQSESEGQEIYPFIEAAAAGTQSVTVRAGWADAETDEAVSLLFDYQGPAASGAPDETIEAALAWYRDALAAVNES